MDEKIQVEKSPGVPNSVVEEEKPADRLSDISPARIERMKKAFRPTWLQDQINSIPKGPGSKKE